MGRRRSITLYSLYTRVNPGTSGELIAYESEKDGPHRLQQ